MIAVGDNSETELFLLQPRSRTAPEVIMDASASFAASSNNPYLCFDQQPEQRHNSHKKIGPESVSGQGRIVQRDDSPSLQVTRKSPLDIDDRFRRRPVSLLQRTTTESPAAPESVVMNSYFEEGDITIDDAEFSAKESSILQQLITGYSDVKKLNNPVIDRSELAERVRGHSYDIFLVCGLGLFVSSFVLTFDMMLKNHIDKSYADDPAIAALKKKNRYFDGHLWFYLPLATYVLGVFISPVVEKLSRILTAYATTMADIWDKRNTDTNENATDRFLKKYNRMKSLLDRLCKLRSCKYVAGSSNRSFCDFSQLSVEIGIDADSGKPTRKVTVAESSEPHFPDEEDFSFSFSTPAENRLKLEKAITETKEWLGRAEKQMRLIRDSSSGGQ